MVHSDTKILFQLQYLTILPGAASPKELKHITMLQDQLHALLRLRIRSFLKIEKRDLEWFCGTS